MSWRAITLGTMDFLYKEVLLSCVGHYMSKAIKTKYVIPKRLSARDTWIARRLFKNNELWRRGIHAPGESYIVLEDTGSLNEIEYVIQEHDADQAGRHFDFRLVVNGKSVSWAIPMKGKRGSLDRMPVPPEKWAAIRQPDHTIEYNKFEGVIPPGNKGAGTVRIWAQGKADVLKIEDGNVHFKIYDGPAKGSYVIVQTKGTQGLILAKKPENAESWTKPRYSRKPEEILDAAQEKGFVAENKVDGAALELRLGSKYNAAYSHRISKRTGTLIEHSDRLPEFRDHAVESLAGTTLRAEAWHKNGTNFLAGTLNSNVLRAREVQREYGDIQLGVFDITHYKGRDVSSLPYVERRALYEQVCKDLGLRAVQPVTQVKDNFAEFYSDRVADRKVPSDGVVLKNPEWSYDEKPWLKVKPYDTVDCVITNITRGGPGKHQDRAGALIVQCEGKKVHVGTGFSDWEREWIWAHRDELIGDTIKADFHVRHGQTTHTGPRFAGFHPDKSEAGLKMYADIMQVNPYQLKSAAGWRAS